MLAFLLPSSHNDNVLIRLTCCCSKLCSAAVCCDHNKPKFVLELSVENHISRPRARLNKAQTMISHEATLRKVRFLDKMAPGMEMKKVKKTKTALARAARDESQLQKPNQARQVRDNLPVRGVFCIRSLVPTSVCIAMLLIVLGMKMIPTASIRPPVRRKMISIVRKVMRILLSIIFVGQY